MQRSLPLTVLVWLGRVHVDDPVFEDLSNDAHRIVLDSEYTSLASLLHVAAWARSQPAITSSGGRGAGAAARRRSTVCAAGSTRW